MRMRDELEQKVGLRFSKGLMAADNKEIYLALLELVQEKLAAAKQIQGEKKLYYISAEFLVGKLLSNNLINLGIYDQVKEALAEAGKDLSQVEEQENEPSLGNGGLGRLAACYLDSAATLGLPGDRRGALLSFRPVQAVFPRPQAAGTPRCLAFSPKLAEEDGRALVHRAPPRKERPPRCCLQTCMFPGMKMVSTSCTCLIWKPWTNPW